jgi:hypothetical protein
VPANGYSNFRQPKTLVPTTTSSYEGRSSVGDQCISIFHPRMSNERLGKDAYGRVNRSAIMERRCEHGGRDDKITPIDIC